MKGESLTDWISPLSWEYMYSRRAKWVKIYIKQKFSMAAFPDFRIPNSTCVPNLVLGACIIWKVLNRRSPTTNINACRHVQVFFTVACKNTLGREEVNLYRTEKFTTHKRRRGSHRTHTFQIAITAVSPIQTMWVLQDPYLLRWLLTSSAVSLYMSLWRKNEGIDSFRSEISLICCYEMFQFDQSKYLWRHRSINRSKINPPSVTWGEGRGSW